MNLPAADCDQAALTHITADPTGKSDELNKILQMQYQCLFQSEI